MGVPAAGADRQRAALNAALVPDVAAPDELLAVDDALTGLAAEDSVAAELIELCYFAGLSIEEAGEVLGMARPTAYERWAFGRVCRIDGCASRTPPGSAPGTCSSPRSGSRRTSGTTSSGGSAATTRACACRSRPCSVGELNWLVMKALEKDRSRRYETAAAFAADVQR